MVYSPAPIPFSRGSAKPKVFLNNSLPLDVAPFVDDPPTAVLDALRQQIDSASSIDVTLSAIAAAAQNLARASGAAIAMGHDGTVLCVGRSGDTAPELGAQLSVDSGISGECIRSGKSLLCDDTQLDSRVDAEVCLRLGLRSIIAVPLRSSDGMVGILEVFSNYPSNFSSGHVDTMRKLGDLVELAHRQVAKAEAEVQEIRESLALPAPATLSEVATADVATAEPRAIEWLRDSQTATEVKRIPYWLVPPVLILILLSFRAWIAWREPAVVSVPPSTQSAQPAAPDTLELTLGGRSGSKPHAGRDAGRGRHKSSHNADSPEHNTDSPEVVVHNFQDQPEPGSAAKVIEAASVSTREQISNDPPQLPVLNTSNAAIGSVLAKSTALPTQPLPISQGVVKGALQYRVQPKYPEQALSMRLSGPVVLLATIGETGSVRQLKVVSGPPVLAEAAMEAVRQWRYQPSRLNGTPISIETQVTVNFKAP